MCSETKDKTLEEIAAAFGDKVVETPVPDETENHDKGDTITHTESVGNNNDAKV